ncbi:rhodanese-like domain-containing protein [Sphingomonas mali]|uniref:rhodanese-like domain-containing protein n=1 Tax=Sphingomonas mali TaxID=40682 RepID=UPI00082D095F|nr:rhodanese-like domain-containing protein [Sphingomonas mali]
MTPLLLAVFLMAADGPPPVNPQIDYQGFQRLAARVSPERAKRRITLMRFMQMAATGGAIILDARSADAFAQGHIAGAINLPLTDFTAPALAAALPDRNQPILIYCNNNFSNDRPPVMLKSAAVSLNIQTYINLAAYGYRNVYELGETVDFDDPKVNWIKG